MGPLNMQCIQKQIMQYILKHDLFVFSYGGRNPGKDALGAVTGAHEALRVARRAEARSAPAAVSLTCGRVSLFVCALHANPNMNQDTLHIKH